MESSWALGSCCATQLLMLDEEPAELVWSY